MARLLDLDVTAVDAAGDGLATYAGRTFAVPFTIPGERVRVQLDERTGRASLVEVLTPSPHRVTARCPHFGPCGGCAWQHIAYPHQLRLKTALVERLVRRTVPGAPSVLPTLAPCGPLADAAATSRTATPSATRTVTGNAEPDRDAGPGPLPSGSAGLDPDAPWEYRQKVHFVFANAPAPAGGNSRRSWAGRLVMGHYARGSRRIVPVQECPVHDERGNAAAFAWHAALGDARVSAAAEESGRGTPREVRPGVLRSIAVRVALHTSELMTTLVVAEDTDKTLRAATKRALARGGTEASFHVNWHPREDAFIFGRDTRHIAGHARLREQVADTSFLISPTAFFQTNVRAADALVRLVREAIPPDADVVDLYAGAGLFALPLAKAGHSVLAIEENRAAVKDGEASRQLNRIPEERCRFLPQAVEAALPRLKRADVIVMDPPRDGCSPGVLEELHDLNPSLLVYVSCNPEALANDLAALTQSGLRIRSIQPVDMFPHTAHVETVVVMDRR